MPDKHVFPSGVTLALWHSNPKNDESPLYCHCFVSLPVVVVVMYLCRCFPAVAYSFHRALPNLKIDTLQHGNVAHNALGHCILSQHDV